MYIVVSTRQGCLSYIRGIFMNKAHANMFVKKFNKENEWGDYAHVEKIYDDSNISHYLYRKEK